ncbi:MAG: hypothetical protein RLZZ428_504, partial [Pseudomonadota bacterium]
MTKLFFVCFSFLVVSPQISWAAFEKNKIEIVAKNVDAVENTFEAKDDVVIYYDDAIIKASSAFFNKKEKRLIIDGDIEMIGYQGNKVHTDHLEIDTTHKEVTFQKLFLMSKNDIWLISSKGKKKKDTYRLERSMISSCDIENPLWKIIFDHSIYDSNAEQMKVYDATMYLWDFPILYTPYLSFSTNKERRSGLLFPSFGSASSGGFFFEQPIFWAVSKSMDVEFIPQIRTLRSVGLYSKFRFVDSPHSRGNITTGYFKDNQTYVQEHNLLNDSHYGIGFDYDTSEVFSHYFHRNVSDGFYLSATYLNDIDYLNLQRGSGVTDALFGLSPLQESKANYYIQNSDYYGGVNIKYFIDTTANARQDETLQTLPSIQLHRYLSHLFVDNLTYSVDMHLNNFFRQTGATMTQAEFKIPVEYTTSFFDDYLNLSLGEEIYYSKYFFGNQEYLYDQFQYSSTIHKVNLFTDLTKKYDTFVHVWQPFIEYTDPATENQLPVHFSQLSDDQQNLFSVGLPEQKYALGFNQYFYNDNAELKFYQRIKQDYYPKRLYQWANISNEMQYNWSKWSLYSSVIYANAFNTFRESTNSISLNEEAYRFTLGHTYKKILPDSTIGEVEANSVNVSTAYIVNKRVSLNAGFIYDLDNSANNQWNIGGD